MVTGDQAPCAARSILITGARGGQGTTTVAAALALHAAAVGDAVLNAPPQQGAAAILGHPAIERGESVAVTGHLTLAAPPAIVAADTVIIDGGLHDGGGEWLSAEQGEHYVVLRGPCYVALATLVGSSARRPDGIILVAEDGRSLSARDVAEVTGLPVVATADSTPRVARTIDAGLLPSRISRLRELSQLRTLVTNPASPYRPLARHRNHPVTKPSQTDTDLPFPRRETAGRPGAGQVSMSRLGRGRHLSMMCELFDGRDGAEHRPSEP